MPPVSTSPAVRCQAALGPGRLVVGVEGLGLRVCNNGIPHLLHQQLQEGKERHQHRLAERLQGRRDWFHLFRRVQEVLQTPSEGRGGMPREGRGGMPQAPRDKPGQAISAS